MKRCDWLRARNVAYEYRDMTVIIYFVIEAFGKIEIAATGEGTHDWRSEGRGNCRRK